MRPLKLFYSYAHEDVAVRDALAQHLDLLERQGIIVTWHDREIVPGREWKDSIDANLNAADIILLLVSKAFLASTFVQEFELPLAMGRHEAREATVVPVLVEDVGDLRKLELSKLEVLPSKAKPLSRWKDTSRALASVAAGIRRVASDIVWDSEGPFSFGPHTFSEAELVPLTGKARERARAGLERLGQALSKTIPPRKVDRTRLRRNANLLVATWSLRQFGRRPSCAVESNYYIAQIISAFDIVALQEIGQDLDRIREVLRILGTDWGYHISDISEGRRGNRERVAIVYYRPRVASRNISGEVVLTDSELIEGSQLARKPLIASFASGDFEFRMCTAHLVWGRSRRDRLAEVEALAGHLSRKASRRSLNMIVLGDLNRGDVTWEGLEPWRQHGFTLDPRDLHLSNASKTRSYDLIAHRFDRNPIAGRKRRMRTGAFDYYAYVFRDEDHAVYGRMLASNADYVDEARRYDHARTFEMSDHLPVWWELDLRRVARGE